MGKFFDFVVKYDPETDTQVDLTKRILYSLILRRLKSKKPAVVFISGDSGEGKSYAALRMQELLLELQGMNLEDHLHKINVYTPIEYPKKLDKLLHDPELKKLNIICMHEAREIVKAKQWHSFLNQAVSDVNAMSRSLKRLCFIIISQFIRDISSDIRYTLNYYIKVDREYGRPVKLRIYKLWKDDSDLEKPKLKKRLLKGYLVDPKGKYKLYQPKYLSLSKPKKEIRQAFEQKDAEGKAKIIRRKLEKLIKEMSIEFEVINKKTDVMVDWYMKNSDQLNLIGKRSRGKWRLKPEAKIVHDLSDQEAKDFEEKLVVKMKERGMA